jgi:hypothetical protein
MVGGVEEGSVDWLGTPTGDRPLPQRSSVGTLYRGSLTTAEVGLMRRNWTRVIRRLAAASLIVVAAPVITLALAGTTASAAPAPSTDTLYVNQANAGPGYTTVESVPLPAGTPGIATPLASDLISLCYGLYTNGIWYGYNPFVPLNICLPFGGGWTVFATTVLGVRVPSPAPNCGVQVMASSSPLDEVGLAPPGATPQECAY